LGIGAAHVGLTLVFFFSVQINNWGPGQAELPFTVMGATYLAVITPATWIAWYKRPPGFALWQCQDCGYPLVGLEKPRCPECGRAFDPRSVKFDRNKLIGERRV